MSRWRVRLAPRIVNDVSNVSRINHESHFSWQAQDSVMLEGVSWCSAHCFIDVSNVSRINHESQIFVAGTIFGDVGG